MDDIAKATELSHKMETASFYFQRVANLMAACERRQTQNDPKSIEKIKPALEYYLEIALRNKARLLGAPHEEVTQ